ncbi:MAG: aldo/keto reductase [Gammaproteobacteria bacterium]|nr:aldo/keto reductase [Gammaproteobacteria bacterium]
MTKLARRPLGNTGLSVSCLGLGTVKFGRNQQVKYPGNYPLPTDCAIQELLALASDLGINLLDTAPAYGSSERRLGRLLTNRDAWVLCSKVGEEFIDGKSVFNFHENHVRKSIERSLRELQTDYLDVVLIHSDGNDLSILENTDCVDTLQRMKNRGLVRSIGMSSKTVAGGLRTLELMDIAMVTYNSSTTAESEVIDYAAAHHKGLLVKKALQSGHLALPTISTSANASVAMDNAGKALMFALSNPGVSSVILGTINPNHLRTNVKAVNLMSS